MDRHAIFILALCLLAIAIGGTLLMYQYKPYTAGEPGPPGVSILVQGDQASIGDRKNYRLTTSAEFAQFWQALYGANAPATPQVDFTGHEVYAVFDGTRASGGYEVAVASVADAQGKRTVTIEHRAPGNSCAVTQNVTSPYEIVSVEKSALPIERVDVDKTVECR